MNYIREAEDVLRHYNALYRSIANLDRQISELVRKQGPSELTAIALDETGVSGGGNHDETFNIMFKLKELTDSRDKTQKELDKIKDILTEIARDHPDYRTVLWMWYVKNEPKEKIAKKLNYSETSMQSLYRIKNQAIRFFAVEYYGLKAM